MFFTKFVASTLLLSPVLALVRIPGVAQPHHKLNGKSNGKRDVQSCGDSDVLSALSEVGAEASSFCSSYLSSFTVTSTTASPGPTDVDVTVTETSVDVVTVVITATNTISTPFLDRRRSAPTLPAFVAPFANDNGDGILSSNCVCFLDASTSTTYTWSATTFQTSTINADCATSTPTASAWFANNETSTAGGPTNTPPTSTSGQTNSTSTSTSQSVLPTSTCAPPIKGCIFSTYVLDYSPLTDASQCTRLCQSTSSCLSYQVGKSDESTVIHCNLLTVDAKTAYDEDGSTTYPEYCDVFFIYEAICPVVPGFP